MWTIHSQLVGGLGNRLFILAFLYGHSKKHNCLFRFDVRNNKHTTDNYDFLLDRFYKLNNHNKNSPEDKIGVWEACFQDYQEFGPPFTDTFYGAYFQNEKYFLDYRADILNLFRAPFPIKKTDRMFIHVRLGDYLHPEHKSVHYFDFSNYFKRCLEKEKGTDLLLFSDSPSEAKKMYPFLADIPVFDSNDELLTFYTMVNCSLGGICSNSSFSWWASWLNTNPQKRVYMPSMWLTNNPIRLNYSSVEVIPVD